MVYFARVLISFLFLAILSGVSFAKCTTKAEQLLKELFVDAQDFQSQRFCLSARQIKEIEDQAGLGGKDNKLDIVSRCSASSRAGVLGYAYEDTVKGKWGPIQYFAVVDAQGKVLVVVVVNQREIRGKPVGQERFLRQYKGKTFKDPLRLRKDISGVTGATISSGSLTQGVRKVLHVHQQLGQGFGEPLCETR